MTWWKKLFSSQRGYLNGSRILFRVDMRIHIRRAVGAWEDEEHIEVRDYNRRILREGEMRDFLRRYHDSGDLVYGSNHRGEPGDDSFPDCDDFALWARAVITRGAIKEDFDYPVAFGGITYTRKTGEYHRANIVFRDNEGIVRVMIFEPQDDKLLEFEAEVETVRQISI